MHPTLEELTAYLLRRLAEVQRNLGQLADSDSAATQFVDIVDSMGLVEFLAVVAEDCGVKPAAIEACVDRRFGTVGELAAALERASLLPRALRDSASTHGTTRAGPLPKAALSHSTRSVSASSVTSWLTAVTFRLPAAIQPAAEINRALRQPDGWLERRAGIHQRRTWADQDPLTAVADAGRECLDRAGLTPQEVGALLVTSEAPPLLVGLAAALHAQLGLGPQTVALEIGGACTGFLAALWTAQALLPHAGAILLLAVEAHSRYLPLVPGASGEDAALFGDGAAAALLHSQPLTQGAISLGEVVLYADGKSRDVLRVETGEGYGVHLRLNRIALAGRAIHVMAECVLDLARRHGLALTDLAGVAVHGGNGRMPGLLARKLGLPLDRVWSETADTGNLGSASLPVAWASHPPSPGGPVIWTAAGAGLTWGAAILGL
jgi:3-oxoacyl-[acyl-carrier-protein] synthase-3